jgi:hypothetical protein
MYPSVHFRAAMLLTVALIIGLSQSCNLNGDKNSITIVGNGKLNTILIPKDADAVVHFAASELMNYLKKITGRELQIKRSDVRHEQNAIQLRVENDPELKLDGFKIEITGKGISLA